MTDMGATSKKPNLTVVQLQKEASLFAVHQSQEREPSLYGVTDGKAVGTHLEQKFQAYLRDHYTYQEGNAAKGIDFPSLNVDIKVTSIRQPQSSCPFRDAQQKIYGLGYSLLIFVYDKSDDADSKSAHLNILHCIFVEAAYTGDYQTTRGLLEILDRQGNADDVQAFLLERNLPLDEIASRELAGAILQNRPRQGYLTISNALQWRLQYGRVIEAAGKIKGIRRLD